MFAIRCDARQCRHWLPLQLGFFVVIVACAPSVPSPRQSAKLPDDVHWSRNSAEHRAVFIQTYRLAAHRLEELARDREPGTWAVVLDGDETVLDNSQYAKELNERGGKFGQESYAEWILRQEAPPLPGVEVFLERVHELGGLIAIVTNRPDELCDSTAADFTRYGIPFDCMLCRVSRQSKASRWEGIREGTAVPGLPPLEILLWIGDKMGDFPGFDQDSRDAQEEDFAEFGERFFVLPNPMYGDWEKNPRN